MAVIFSKKIKRLTRLTRKSTISIVSCIVMLLTALVLSRPAITSTGEIRGGTFYSSNLADFVTQVTIHDKDGNIIEQHGTVYIGESYDIAIAFSENNVSGQEKQFEYNDEGYLTYQIPSFFLCREVQNGNIKDSNDDIVGNYSIDDTGLLKVRFIDGYIDSTKASMTINLGATASGIHGGGNEPIDFGGYIIEVNVVADGTLDVQKTAGEYDPRTHSIPYEIKVEAKNGNFSNINYTDTFTTSGITTDTSSIIYTSLDGSTVYDSMPTVLNSGEGFLIKYNAILDESVYAGKNKVSYKAKNRVDFTGIGEDGGITVSDTAEKSIKTTFLEKSGKDEPSNSRIKWTVTVGDGSTVVDGLTITDAPGTGLSFDTSQGISASMWTYSQNGVFAETEKFNIPFGANPSVITLPSNKGAYRYVLTYYTDYSLESGVVTQQFSNTVSTSDSLHGSVQVTSTATGHATGAPPEINKTVDKNADSSALHYKIEIDVPAFYGGTSGFYFYDTYSKFEFAGNEYFLGNAIENLSVYTVDSNDYTRVYSPYTSGSTDYTYIYSASTDPRSSYIYFNVRSGSTSNSNWLESKDTTLCIEYDLPLDSIAYTRLGEGTYVPSDDITLSDLIGFELSVKNRGRIYFNNKLQYEDSEAIYKEVSDTILHKIGAEVDGDAIEYTVVFNNIDEQSNNLLKRKMKELIFHDALCTEGMRYIDDTLFCDIYNSNLSRIRFTYKYSKPISNNTSINAYANDFVWYSGDSTSYNTLYSYAQSSGIGGSSSSTARIVFRYKVSIDKTSSQFNTTEPSVPMTNIARLTGIMPDDTPFDSGEAECTVNCCTDIIKKEVEHVDGSNRAEFTITINPSGVDLLNGVTQMTVIDRMTENLIPVLSTVKVYLKNEGVWTETETQYTYDPDENALSFILPDDTPVKITYTTVITDIGDNISIGNSVELQGYAQYHAAVNTEFSVFESGGAASAENFRFNLLKQSADHHMPLQGAVFALYGPKHSERQGVPTDGTEPTVTIGDTTLWYYTSYTTDRNGISVIETNENGLPMFSVQGLYAIKEISAPQGYHLYSNPIWFYAEEVPENPIAGIEALAADLPLVVPNAPFTYQLPSTGGTGLYTVYAFGGFLIILSGILLCVIRKKRI